MNEWREVTTDVHNGHCLVQTADTAVLHLERSYFETNGSKHGHNTAINFTVSTLR